MNFNMSSTDPSFSLQPPGAGWGRAAHQDLSVALGLVKTAVADSSRE